MSQIRTYAKDCISLAMGMQISCFNMNDVDGEVLLYSASLAEVTCALL